jgi:isopentenyl-diphosphate delta-isomerase
VNPLAEPELILLVDKEDKASGYEEKLQVHTEGLLHRAFSIFIFNQMGEMLIQRRYSGKYHSPGLWSNTCCSHQRAGETLEQAVHDRLMYEMGFGTELYEVFSFIYKTEFDNGLIENELDHVFFGHYDGQVSPEPSEVEGYRWIPMDELKGEMECHPESFTYWFKKCINKVLEHL